jgi:hypothetical protein
VIAFEETNLTYGIFSRIHGGNVTRKLPAPFGRVKFWFGVFDAEICTTTLKNNAPLKEPCTVIVPEAFESKT